LLLDPAEIFQAMSVLMLREKEKDEEDMEFIAEMVATLNGILFTAPELFVLRERLKNRSVSGK
jgi:hypothetical protein